MNSSNNSKTKKERKKTAREKSAGAIIVREERGVSLYLLLHYPPTGKSSREYWDLPKGHMEKGEAEQDTARREVQEETGITDFELLEGFRQVIHYTFQFHGRRISKTVAFFLAKTRHKQVKISHEHVGFKWLPHEEAQKQLTFANARRIVQKANEFLQKK